MTPQGMILQLDAMARRRCEKLEIEDEWYRRDHKVALLRAIPDGAIYRIGSDIHVVYLDGDGDWGDYELDEEFYWEEGLSSLDQLDYIVERGVREECTERYSAYRETLEDLLTVIAKEEDLWEHRVKREVQLDSMEAMIDHVASRVENQADVQGIFFREDRFLYKVDDMWYAGLRLDDGWHDCTLEVDESSLTEQEFADLEEENFSGIEGPFKGPREFAVYLVEECFGEDME